MGLVLADRVKETTTTTGTGTITLLGAATGYRSFAAVGNGNLTYYAIIDSTNNAWEVGLGTYTAAGTTLSRTTVFSNSLSTTALISFAAGTKDVICTQPAWSTLNSSNMGFGNLSLSTLSTGTDNIAIGLNTLPAVTSTSRNVAIGNNAGQRAANYNGVFIGHNAGSGMTNPNSDGMAIGAYAVGNNSFYTGSGLTAIGYYALSKSYTTNTTAVGTYALINSLNAQYSVAVGHSAFYSLGSGWYSTAVGYQAGYSQDSGNYNSFFGYQAGYGGTTPSGQGNTALGALTMSVYTSGAYNTCVGYAAGLNLTSQSNNTLIGMNAGANIKGATNTAVGYQALVGATNFSGTNLTAIGSDTGPAVTSAQLGVLVGSSAGAALTSAWYSIFIGSNSGKSITSGDGNICIGYQTLGAASVTTGTYNTYIGWRAGYLASGNGSQNLCIGYLSGVSMAAGSNNVILGGYGATGGIVDVSATNNNVIISDNNGGIKLYTTTSGLGGYNVPMADKGAVSATGSTGTVNFDASTQQVLNVTTAATANFTLNVRGNATTTFNSAQPVNQSLEIQYWNLNGATPYYMTALTMDGAAQTVRWLGGTAPAAGNANAIDVYTFTIFKTAGSTYTVLGKFEKYA